MSEWRVYTADIPQCTSCGMWMPFARYRRGQGTDAREITDYCPHCGGSMTVSVFYSFSRDYRIGIDGQPRKKCKKSFEGPMDVCTVLCNDCSTYWDGDNTIWGEDGVFVRGEGIGV